MAQRQWKIESVPRRKRAQAIRFIAGGRADDAIADMRAQMLRQTLEVKDNCGVRLWWSRRGRQCVAAAAIVSRAGKTGMLFHCPADAPGVDVDAATDLIGRVSRDAVAGGLYLVQTLQDADKPADVEVIQRAGYQLLADLIYMRRSFGGEVSDELAAAEPADLVWRNYEQLSEQELADVIAQTYAGSLDCQAIAGLREIPDVIEGHKSSGRFRPEAWLIVYADDAPAGCILVNDYADTADVVYMGVVPECRGRGLSRTMLARACKAARQRHLRSMTLAVDSANVYALEVYRSAGFAQIDRRLAYFLVGETSEANTG